MSIAENKEYICPHLWVAHKVAANNLTPGLIEKAQSECNTTGCKVRVEAIFNEAGERVTKIISGNPDTECKSPDRIERTR